MEKKINLFTSKGKQMQLPVEFNVNKNQLQLPKNYDDSTENKKADSEIILNKECKTVKLANGKNCSLVSFLTGS